MESQLLVTVPQCIVAVLLVGLRLPAVDILPGGAAASRLREDADRDLACLMLHRLIPVLVIHNTLSLRNALVVL